MVKYVLEVKEILLREGINLIIVNVRFLKLIDEGMLKVLLKNYKNVVIIEDNIVIGGFGSRINKFIIDNEYNVNIFNIVILEEFVKYGNIDELYDFVGLLLKSIVDKIRKLVIE